MMVVAHNLLSQFTNRQLKITGDKKSKASEKLSTGYKINRSSDDAAGLQISEKMRSQIRGASRASTNAQDGISLIQTAEGALNETHDILQRINELVIQGANDTNQDVDREAIQQEINQLLTEINKISDSTTFNDMPVLKTHDNGQDTLQFQIGGQSWQGIGFEIRDINTTTLEIDNILVDSHEHAEEAIPAVQDAINSVSGYRSYLGAFQNRLEHSISVNDNTAENTQASESRIRDTDMAKEIVELSKHNILEQAGQSMLAQANQSTQGVLSLLQ